MRVALLFTFVVDVEHEYVGYSSIPMCAGLRGGDLIHAVFENCFYVSLHAEVNSAYIGYRSGDLKMKVH